jgi:TonB family protein
MKLLSFDTILNEKEQSSTGKGWVVSLGTHILVLAILCLPFLVRQVPPPESEGLLVNLGLPDQGQGEETPKGETMELASPDRDNTLREEPTPEPAKRETKQASSAPLSSKVESDIVVKEREAKAKADAEARQRAEEEAKRQAAYNQTKKSYGDLLGGAGKGNTGKPGSQGDPNGDPNSDILEGISTGSGRVGGGLGNRGVLHEPKIDDRSQKTGRVVISVCVDKTGKVIKAEYTQKGSTTTDSELKDIARKAAQQFKFTPSEIVEQCGTITVDFKIRG